MFKKITIECCNECPFCILQINGGEECHHVDAIEVDLHDCETLINENCPLDDLWSTLPPKSMFVLTADREIIIFNGMGKRTGIVKFSDESFSFEGSVEQSADKFFSFLKRIFIPFFKEES